MTNLVPFLLAFIILTLVFGHLADLKSRTTLRILCGVLAVYACALLALWITPNAWALPSTALAAACATIALRGEGLSRLTAALGRLRFRLYLLSVATLSLLVFLSIPITTFLTSPGELGVHLEYLTTVNARDAMVIVYVAAVAYAAAATSRMRTSLTLLAVASLVLGLLYSFALPFGYPAMTGLAFEQIQVSWISLAQRLLCDATTLVATALGLHIALLRYGARPILLAVMLIATSLVAATVLSVSRDQIGGAGDDAIGDLREGPLRFSPEHPNVLIVFLDRFMGSYLEPLLEDHPELAEQLSGFTWYPRSVSAGENSIAGVHAMLGGYDYTPVEMNARGKPLRDLSTEAFTILPYNFSRSRYRVNVLGPRGLGFTVAGDCSYLRLQGVHCSHIPVTVSTDRAEQSGFSLRELAESNYADLLVLLGSMRSAPYVLKDVLYRRGPWRPFMDHSAGTTFRQWAELHALDALSFTGASEPNYNFVSNILPHEPYYLAENCLPQKERFEVPDDEVRRRGHVSLFSLQHFTGAKCSLLAVAKYLDFLKAHKVYDSTTIVIVSDHGIVGPVRDDSTRARTGGTQDELFVRTRSVLLVKPRNRTGPIKISEEFMPNAEMPRLVCSEIGGCVNPYLGDAPIQTLGRNDPFMVSFVPWQFSLQKVNTFDITQQYALTGKDPYDVRGWKAVSPSTLPSRPGPE